MNNPKLTYLREKAGQLPLDPGVYLMKGADGNIIYVGKAKALRNRVSSYFRSVDKHVEKVYRMVEQARDFSTIVTSSEFEALVLECSLIKQYNPKYNILLKDDKGYHYIRISGDVYPRITAEKQVVSKDGARYLGPYTSSFVVNQTVEEVNKAFLLPTCRKKFPEDFRKGRPCLNYHIKQCMGVCTGRIKQREYAEIIQQSLDFIQGGSDTTMALLNSKMEQAAENLDFEKAAQYRDRIKAIAKINDQQNVVFAKTQDQDVLAIVQSGEESCAVLIKFRGRRLVDKQDFSLGEIAHLATARRDFLLSYYGSGAEIPKQIALDGSCEELDLVTRYLEEKRGGKVRIFVPERGEGLKLTQMAVTNAAQQLAHKTQRVGKDLAALDELARLLGLAHPPEYIEAYDISNYGSETMLGGMVVFENGRPLKAAYKKFNIKTLEGTDDYGAMREVISRRLARYQEEKDSGQGFGRLPDLILLDGGKGHVSAVAPLLEELGLSIPLFGMVKDQKHRTRAIATNGGEISIAKSRSAFTLLTGIQDEVHRFSITQMQKKHTKSAFTLQLTQLPGVGEKRAVGLLKHFGTQKALRAATAEELAAAPGMNKPTAHKVYAFFHGEDAPQQPQEAPEEQTQ